MLIYVNEKGAVLQVKSAVGKRVFNRTKFVVSMNSVNCVFRCQHAQSRGNLPAGYVFASEVTGGRGD